MSRFQCELDADASAIKVNVQDENGEAQAYSFAFDPRSGHYTCEELAELEARFGPDWLASLERQVRQLIDQAVMTRRRAERDDPWGF